MNRLMWHFQISNMRFSSLVRRRLSLRYTLSFKSLLWWERKKLKIFNSTPKVEWPLRMQLVGEEVMIQMTRNIKKILKEEQTESLWPGLNHAMNLQTNPLNLKFQTEISVFMEQLLGQTYCYSQLKTVSSTLLSPISLCSQLKTLKSHGSKE